MLSTSKILFVWGGMSFSRRLVNKKTIGVLALIMLMINSTDSSSAECMSSKHKQITFSAHMILSTSIYIVMKRIDLVLVGPRRNSLASLAATDAAVIEGVFVDPIDSALVLPTVPSCGINFLDRITVSISDSGKSRRLCSTGQKGRTCCLIISW